MMVYSNISHHQRLCDVRVKAAVLYTQYYLALNYCTATICRILRQVALLLLATIADTGLEY